MTRYIENVTRNYIIYRLTITKSRNRLDPETSRALLCLKSWTFEKIGRKYELSDEEDGSDI